MLGPATVRVADGMEDTVTDDSWQQLLNVKRQQDGAHSRKDEIVDQEQGLELVWVAIAHPFSTSEDDRVIADNEDAGLLQSRHRGLAGNESELGGRIAHGGRPGLVKDGP